MKTFNVQRSTYNVQPGRGHAKRMALFARGCQSPAFRQNSVIQPIGFRDNEQIVLVGSTTKHAKYAEGI